MENEVKWVEEFSPTNLAHSLHFSGKFDTNVKEKYEDADVISKF